MANLRRARNSVCRGWSETGLAWRGCVLSGICLAAVCLGFVSAARAQTEAEKIARILASADLAYGEHLAGQCATCHRKDADKGIPVIAGLVDVYLVQTMLEYKTASEGRTNIAMVNIAKNLSEEEIGALAKYLSMQQPE